jgi:hypothetical protein
MAISLAVSIAIEAQPLTTTAMPAHRSATRPTYRFCTTGSKLIF